MLFYEGRSSECSRASEVEEAEEAERRGTVVLENKLLFNYSPAAHVEEELSLFVPPLLQ